MKNIFLFLFLALSITASAQTRQDRTSLTVSQNLKQAFISAGYGSHTLPDRWRAFYDGSATVRVLCLEQPDNFNGLRTVTVNGAQTEFDFIEFEDTSVVRYWIYRELEVFVGQLPGVSGFTVLNANNTWTATIICNGVTYTGTDNNKRVDAIARALRTTLNGQQQAFQQINGRNAAPPPTMKKRQ